MDTFIRERRETGSNQSPNPYQVTVYVVTYMNTYDPSNIGIVGVFTTQELANEFIHRSYAGLTADRYFIQQTYMNPPPLMVPARFATNTINNF